MFKRKSLLRAYSFKNNKQVAKSTHIHTCYNSQEFCFHSRNVHENFSNESIPNELQQKSLIALNTNHWLFVQTKLHFNLIFHSGFIRPLKNGNGPYVLNNVLPVVRFLHSQVLPNSYEWFFLRPGSLLSCKLYVCMFGKKKKQKKSHLFTAYSINRFFFEKNHFPDLEVTVNSILTYV